MKLIVGSIAVNQKYPTKRHSIFLVFFSNIFWSKIESYERDDIDFLKKKAR